MGVKGQRGGKQTIALTPSKDLSRALSLLKTGESIMSRLLEQADVHPHIQGIMGRDTAYLRRVWLDMAANELYLCPTVP